MLVVLEFVSVFFFLCFVFNKFTHSKVPHSQRYVIVPDGFT